MKLYISKTDSSSDKKIVLDDMILTTNLPTSAGSKMLDNYKSLFEAEVVTKLKANGYDVFAKANTGEFNIDLLGETSYYGAVSDNEGNLLNASAQIVKDDEAIAAVGLDVNGVARRAAALAGLTYVKPTYGTVSRFGTINCASSGDTVGVSAKSADICSEVLTAIAGHDDKDGTSLGDDKCDLVKKGADFAPVKKIAVAKALVDLADGETKAVVDAFIAKAKAAGIEVCEIDANELLVAKTAWNILMSAETCNNVSRFDGVKYGYRSSDYETIDELYTNSRTEAFGYLIKQTILFGSETLSDENYMKVYDKALRLRRVLCECFEGLFSSYDAILLPATSKRSYKAEEVKNDKFIAYEESAFTAPASITGLPSVVCEGVQLIGKAFSENSLLNVAKLCEEEGAR